MTDSVQRVRRVPRDVLWWTFVSYRAAKPFTVDLFKVQQRILAGALPRDTIVARGVAGTLTIKEFDPHLSGARRAMMPFLLSERSRMRGKKGAQTSARY